MGSNSVMQCGRTGQIQARVDVVLGDRAGGMCPGAMASGTFHSSRVKTRVCLTSSKDGCVSQGGGWDHVHYLCYYRRPLSRAVMLQTRMEASSE